MSECLHLIRFVRPPSECNLGLTLEVTNRKNFDFLDPRAHLNNSRKSLQSETSPVCKSKFQDSSPSPSRCQQHAPLKVFQPVPQMHSQPENSSAYQRIPLCPSARSLPDSQLYSSSSNSNGHKIDRSKPTMSTSYLPLPYKAEASSSRDCHQPSIPVAVACGSSSNRLTLPVYKTPPMPKACQDYYDPIDSLKMSVKSGPPTMTNYVSISSLKVIRPVLWKFYVT